MEYIYNGGKQTDYKNPSNDILMKLTKRWKHFLINLTKFNKLEKDLEKYPKFLDWFLTTDKIDPSKITKTTHERDWEVLFFEVGREILSNLSDFMLNPSKCTKDKKRPKILK